MTVRTVLGDIERQQLGRVDYHEHLFQVSPLLPGDELEDEASSGAEAAELRFSGFDAMIDATPIGLGRKPDGLARISAATGLLVIATTGAHREAHYGNGHWLLEESEEQLARRFVADLTTGMPECDDTVGPRTSIRAGLLKAGIDYWAITDFQRRVLGACAVAHRETGAPVMIHLEHGSAAMEVLAILADLGVSGDSVVLAHIDRNPDPLLHADVAATGASLGYDGFARTREWPDSVLIDCMVAVAELGFANRVLIGGDVARSTRYRNYGGMPGLAYLGLHVIPRLVRAGYADLVHAALVDNPARLLSSIHPIEEKP